MWHNRAIVFACAAWEVRAAVSVDLAPRSSFLSRHGLLNNSDSEEDVTALKGTISSLTYDKAELTHTVQSMLHNNRTASLENEISQLHAVSGQSEKISQQRRTELALELKGATHEILSERELLAEKDRAMKKLKQQIKDMSAVDAQKDLAFGNLQAKANQMGEENIRNLQEARQEMRKETFEVAERATQKRGEAEKKLAEAIDAIHQLNGQKEELRQSGREVLNESDTEKAEIVEMKKQVQAAVQDKQEMLKTLQGLVADNGRLKSDVSKSAEQLEKQGHEMAKDHAETMEELSRYRKLIEHPKKAEASQKPRQQKPEQQQVQAQPNRAEDSSKDATIKAKKSVQASDGKLKAASAPDMVVVLPAETPIMHMSHPKPREEPDPSMMGDLAKLDNYITNSKMDLEEDDDQED